MGIIPLSRLVVAINDTKCIIGSNLLEGNQPFSPGGQKTKKVCLIQLSLVIAHILINILILYKPLTLKQARPSEEHVISNKEAF